MRSRASWCTVQWVSEWASERVRERVSERAREWLSEWIFWINEGFVQLKYSSEIPPTYLLYRLHHHCGNPLYTNPLDILCDRALHNHPSRSWQHQCICMLLYSRFRTNQTQVNIPHTCLPALDNWHNWHHYKLKVVAYNMVLNTTPQQLRKNILFLI